MLVAPAAGLTLEDIQGMTDALLASGATINEVNCLRKHMSAVKGGQLARAVAPATLITLALSDVIGSPLDVIASGPTVPDQTTWADAWAIVQRYELESRLPQPVLARLQAGLDGQLPDTPKADDPVFETSQTIVVADNRMAAEAAARKAEEVGLQHLAADHLPGRRGEPGGAAWRLDLGREIEAFDTPLAAPACLILGGETTVTLGVPPGKGGRNQELALAAGLALQGDGRIVVASLATDGTDGPTDSAGGLGDGGRWNAAGRWVWMRKPICVATMRTPIWRLLAISLVTGPTQTNVNDIVFVFVE